VTRTTGGDVTDEAIDGTDSNGAAPNFGYDAAGRLTSAVVPGRTLGYGYGPTTGCTLNSNAGKNTNRTSLVDNGTTTTYCYDNADRLTSSTDATVGAVGYDAHGNTTAMFGETRSYDGADRHVSTTTAGSSVLYSRDATDRIVARTATIQPTQRAVSTATTGSATATSLTVNRPVGTQSGDVLLAAVTPR
jgi:YD repeat-containing protein